MYEHVRGTIWCKLVYNVHYIWYSMLVDSCIAMTTVESLTVGPSNVIFSPQLPIVLTIVQQVHQHHKLLN